MVISACLIQNFDLFFFKKAKIPSKQCLLERVWGANRLAVFLEAQLLFLIFTSLFMTLLL